MSKTSVLALTLIGSFCALTLLGFVLPANAANPKYTACLKEAEGKGLLVTNTQGKAAGGRANRGLADQRKAFMTACMAKK